MVSKKKTQWDESELTVTLLHTGTHADIFG